MSFDKATVQGLAFARPRRARRVAMALVLAGVLTSPAQARAADDPIAASATEAKALRDSLFRQSLKNPTDVALAMAYAKACIAVKDLEGAIGALERVLYYLPGDKPTEAQLGLLYAQLESPQMAAHYLDDASNGPGLDESLRAKVAASAHAASEHAAANHFFGSLQAGLRSQSNAAFNPDNDILRISNQDYLFNHPHDRGGDVNGFQLAQIGYDYDLGNQRGDTVEARFAGYATQQVRLTDLNVGLYDVSIGPRLFLSPDNLPGWSVKPYAAGGQIFLAGQRYLASGGAGIVADIPLRANLLLQPGAEVRRVSFADVSVFSSLNSGDTATASVTATAIIDPALSVIGRFVYTRDTAAASYQSLNADAEELALVARLPSPLGTLSAPWTVSPYIKLLHSRFDAPNPYVDSATTRHDSEIETGLVLTTPVLTHVTIVTNLQYARVASNIPNYRLRNFSILTGPMVSF